MSRKSCGFGKFLLGGCVGAGLALLFAPQDGKKTRRDLKLKLDELVEKVKELDPNEVKTDIIKKVEELRMELSDLDKEKALNIAKNQAKKVGKKAGELVDYAKEKSTPVVEKAVEEVRTATLKAAKEVVNRLEEKENNSNANKQLKKPKKA